jgi:hypothetical protein
MTNETRDVLRRFDEAVDRMNRNGAALRASAARLREVTPRAPQPVRHLA